LIVIFGAHIEYKCSKGGFNNYVKRSSASLWIFKPLSECLYSICAYKIRINLYIYIFCVYEHVIQLDIHNNIKNINNYTFSIINVNSVPGVNRTGEVVFYWFIDITLTNQRSCISCDVALQFITFNRQLFLQNLISECKYFYIMSVIPVFMVCSASLLSRHTWFVSLYVWVSCKGQRTLTLDQLTHTHEHKYALYYTNTL